jgi:hypothetical protein
MRNKFPGLELLKGCSDILSSMWEHLDGMYIDGVFDKQTNGELLADYLGQLIDDAIYKKYDLKTCIYEAGEETGYFGRYTKIEMRNTHIFVEGYIDIDDTGCDVKDGADMLMRMFPEAFEFIRCNQSEKRSNMWVLQYGLSLAELSQFMFEQEEAA